MATRTVSAKTALKQKSVLEEVALGKRKLQPNTPTDRSAALEDVIRHFAGVSGQSPDELRNEIRLMGGDSIITDKEAKAIFARLEDQYHRENMFSVSDLCSPPVSLDTSTGDTSSGKPSTIHNGCVDPAEDTSVCGIVEIIAKKLGI